MTRVVLVSGGATGIGRAVAARFLAGGDEVIIVGRRVDALTRAVDELGRTVANGAISAVAADLSDPEQVEHVARTVVDRHGRVDVLVNNAGGNVLNRPDADPPAGLAWSAWHWLGNFRSNVLTAVLLTEALVDRFADHGRVLLLSSIAAFRGSGSGSYAAAKAALHPYAFDLASALGPRGITVNVVAPGYIAGTEFFDGGLTEERTRTLVAQTLTGRAGAVDDVAETIAWLASPGAGHITGQIVQVNGGAVSGR